MTLKNLIYQSILWRGLYFMSVLGLNIMIARYYEASYSGLIYFVTNSFALIVTVGTLSLEAGIAYYLVSGKMKPPLLANFVVVWTLVAMILVYIMLHLLVSYSVISANYSSFYFAACCYIGGCMLVNFFTAFFYAEKDFFAPNVVMTSVNLILMLLIPFSNGTMVSKEQYINIYFAGFLTQGLFIASYFMLRHHAGWKLAFPSISSLRPVFKYALMAFWANFIFFLLYRIDYWFVEKYCSAKDLGNYIQVSKLVQVFMLLPMIVASAVFPMSASGDKTIIQQGVATLARIMALVYLLACSIIGILGYWLFPLIYGQTFDNMFIPFILLIPGILSLNIITLLGAYFAGQNKVWINAACSLIGLVVIFAGDLTFIPRNGIRAAAVVSSAGYIVTLCFLLYFFFKDTSMHLKDIFIVGTNDARFVKSAFDKIKKTFQ